MIVRMQDKLANLLLGTEEEDSPIVDESRMAVWDGNKLVHPPAPRPDDISHLIPYVPDWMLDEVSIGTTMFVDPVEFAELDYELQQQFDVLKY